MILTFKDFINEMINIDDEISVKIDNASQEFISYLIDKFTLVVTKRSMKNLRPVKINGSVGNNCTLNITMTNKDVINGVYESEGLTISINGEVIYDVDRKDFDENKVVDKISDEYIKFLKSKKYQVKL